MNHPSDPPGAQVADDPSATRYVIRDNEAPVGFVTYRLGPGVITFLHTEVDPAREGEGLGSVLVRGALDDARARGLSVHPVCSFVAGYIERHPAYADLVAG
jgi:predicted GNAT family acetyltransferase